MKNFNIIGRSKLWLTISGAILATSLACLIIFGLRPGIDFTGGSVMQVIAPGMTVDDVRTTAEAQGFSPVVQSVGEDGYFLRLNEITEDDHQKILTALRVASPDTTEERFDVVGPVIGAELRNDSIKAVIVLLVLIALYVAYAFRKVFQPIASWKYGIVTMISAFHDVIIPLGAFALLGHFFGFEIDTAFVAAMLTILGYSINDTIVVLDRTRENLLRHRGSEDFGDTVNKSVVETLGRSLNTTFTTLLPLVAIFLIGGETTRAFSLALIIGIASGAYSSIFVASPLLVMWERWDKKKKA